MLRKAALAMLHFYPIFRPREGRQERGPRSLPVALDVPPRLARVGGLPDETRPGGHRKPGPARSPRAGYRRHSRYEATRLRAIGAWLQRTRPDEADRQGVLLSASSASRCTDRPSTCSWKNTAPALPCPFAPTLTCCATACGFALADQGARTRGSLALKTPSLQNLPANRKYQTSEEKINKLILHLPLPCYRLRV